MRMHPEETALPMLSGSVVPWIRRAAWRQARSLAADLGSSHLEHVLPCDASARTDFRNAFARQPRDRDYGGDGADHHPRCAGRARARCRHAAQRTVRRASACPRLERLWRRKTCGRRSLPTTTSSISRRSSTRALSSNISRTWLPIFPDAGRETGHPRFHARSSKLR
jgi:hypothetical protein